MVLTDKWQCPCIHIVNCTHGDIRTPLLGGVADYEGLVEVCVEGAYYPVSLDNGQFSVREATVICKQLRIGNGKPLLTCHSIMMICAYISLFSWHATECFIIIWFSSSIILEDCQNQMWQRRFWQLNWYFLMPNISLISYWSTTSRSSMFSVGYAYSCHNNCHG